MNEQLITEFEVLSEEIARYLAAVDAFRAAGCEPTWRPEFHPEPMKSTVAASPRYLRSDARLH